MLNVELKGVTQTSFESVNANICVINCKKMRLLIFLIQLLNCLGDKINCAKCTGQIENGTLIDNAPCFDGSTDGHITGEIDGQGACQTIKFNETNDIFSKLTIQRDFASSGYSSDSKLVTYYRDCNTQPCAGFNETLPINFESHNSSECFSCNGIGHKDLIPILDLCINPFDDKEWSIRCEDGDQFWIKFKF